MTAMAQLSQVAQWLCAELNGADAPFSSVSTDSRQLQPGALFVALKGERFDAHDHLEAAVQAGAAGAIVARQVPVGLPQILVSDTLKALQALAQRWRLQFSAPVIE